MLFFLGFPKFNILQLCQKCSATTRNQENDLSLTYGRKYGILGTVKEGYLKVTCFDGSVVFYGKPRILILMPS